MTTFNIGVSALRAMQRAIATAGHNIANVNTEGYNRQRVELTEFIPQGFSSGFQGKGVQVVDVKRVVDDFLVGQVRANAASNGSSDTLHELASRVDTILGNPEAGVATAIDSFFKNVQTLAANPTSIPTRQTVISEAGTVAERFTALHSRLDDVASMTDGKIRQTVDDINSMATTIADLNQQIVHARGEAAGKVPNDLVDQRDQWLDKLAAIAGVQTSVQDDGAINVSVGNGQTLVMGNKAMTLDVVRNPIDSSRLEISYKGVGGTSLITKGFTKGELAGILRFRDEVLTPAQDQVGRLGVSFAMTVNAQHRDGMDLNGAMGKDVFSVAKPFTLAASTNAGAIDVSFDPANVKNLTADRYQLRYDGSNYVLHDITAQTTSTLGPGGPFNVAGLTITETTPPNAGDTWMLQPVRNGARDIGAVLTDPRTLAAANPIAASAATANVSDAKVSVTVLDPANANLTTPATITFNSPPTSYQIDGNGPFTYNDGDVVDYNGWRVQFTGAVKAGDQFTVGSNAGGVGDSGNMKQLADLQKSKVMEGGNATYGESYASLVGQVGAQTRQANLAAKSSSALLQESTDAKAEVSGVNLDEEAADLMRFQQSYQAAARVITTANELFQSLLRAAGG